jgi:hypothetical protein
VIPPAANAAFVAAMEDVLEVYTRPHDPARPLVCLDETSKQLVAETRTPIPMQPGQPARYDYEYQRNGTANLFMLFAPLEGWRHVKVTDRRTAIDYAHVLKEVSDIHFTKADKIVLVQDNLNTHSPASLYDAFPPAEAALPSASSGTTRPSTAAGSTWRRRNWLSSPANASTGVSPTSPHCNARWRRGSSAATPTTPRPTGALQPNPPASS